MTRLDVNGAWVEADASGAVWWPDKRVLVVADLHFEKGSAFASRGQFLPPYDTAATLARLAALCLRRAPDHVIALGDSFHDREAAARLSPDDRAMIRRLTERHRWTWIIGNHDPDPPADLGGAVAQEVALGPLVFRHEPQPGQAGRGEIAGHLHPCAAVRVRGRRVRRRCFVGDGQRLVLPAFGAYTGGLDVLDTAFALLLPGEFTTWLLGRDQVYAVPRRQLVARAA